MDIYNEFIQKILESGFNEDFFNNVDLTTIKNFIIFLNHNYYSDGLSYISDEDYDKLYEFYKRKTNEEINIDEKYKETLPIYMSSLKKLYSNSKLNHFIENYTSSNIIISSKLDGMAFLFIKNKKNITLYTKGTGYVGRNITHYLPYLNFNRLSLNSYEKIWLRGELIISHKYSKDFNMKSGFLRSQVIGLLNKKIEDSQVDLYKKVDLVFYEILFPYNLNVETQFIILKTLNLLVPRYNIVEKKNYNFSKIYHEFIEKEKYDIDGLVISDMDGTNKIAYKENIYFAKTEIIDIIWNISKDLKYIPSLILNPVKLNKITVEKINGYNAKYLFNNSLGINSKVIIKYSGNIIPILYQIITHSRKIPIPPNSQWDENKIHLVSNVLTTEGLAKVILKYFIVFEINHFKEKSIFNIITFLINKNYKVKNIFNFIDSVGNEILLQNMILGKKKDIFLKEVLETFKNKHIKIIPLLSATNYFIGFNENKLENIILNYPELIDKLINDINLENIDFLDKNKLLSIKYVSVITCNSFINGMNKFIKNKEKFDTYFKINYTYLDKNKIKVYLNKINSDYIFEKYSDYLLITPNKKNADYIIVNDYNLCNSDNICHINDIDKIIKNI